MLNQIKPYRFYPFIFANMKKNKKYLFLMLLMLFSSIILKAQFNFTENNYPATATEIKGCAPFTVNFTKCTTCGNVIYQFADNLPISGSNVSTFTYTTPGLYSVTMFYDAGMGVSGSVKKINYVRVLPTPALSLTLARCNGRQVVLTVQNAGYDSYEADFGDQTPAVFTPIALNTPFTKIYPIITNPTGPVYTVKVSGRYNLGRIDGGKCGKDSILTIRTYQTLTELNTAGEIGMSIAITSKPKSICEGVIDLNFNGFKKDLLFELFISEDNAPRTLIKTWQDTTSVGISRSIPKLNTLLKKYDFYLKVTDKCGNFITLMQGISATTTAPIEVKKLNSTIENNKIKLSWEATGSSFEDLKTYQILKNNVKTATTQNLVFEEDFITNNANPIISVPSCYKITNMASCGFVALFSSETCPILLKVVRNSEDVFAPRIITWTAYKNSNNEQVNYKLQKINVAGTVYEEISLNNSLNYIDSAEDLENQIITYKIVGTTISTTAVSAFASSSNIVNIDRKYKMQFPTAFTPNNDKLNDTFVPKGFFVKKYSMLIFDENNQKIFDTKSFTEGWNGERNGVPLPPSVYVYVCEIEDFLGNSFSYRGTLTLIR